MAFSLKFWSVIISLLFQINGGLTLICYYCNTRDHEGCDDIRYGKNTTIVKVCEGPCAMVKGQWGNENGRKYLIWRGCSTVSMCSQATALCCHCREDYCNYANECFSRGNVRLPGVFIFLFTPCYIFVNAILSNGRSCF